MLRPLLACLIGMTLGAAARADDGTTLYLGDISVSGQAQIVAALQTIKSALHEPLSNDPAHADDLVCRINKGLGEQREYLDCATNRYYTRERDALHGSVMVGTTGLPHGGEAVQGLKAMIQRRPDHSIHVPVQGGALQALLARLPDDAQVVDPAATTAPGQVPAAAIPAASTQAAPAAATKPPAGTPFKSWA